jgi:CRP-like cAMP-binding protein
MGGYDEGVYRIYLGQVPMFAACTDAQIEEVRQLAEFRALDPGTVLLRQGDVGEEFFILGSGEVTVSRDGNDVARLEAGAWFGELSLFDHAPRDATVVAESGVTVLALERPAFQQLLGDLPGFRDALLTGMARRLHALDAKA